MELDQLLFKKIWKWVAKLKQNPNPDNPISTVYLKDIKNSLTILARTLTGLPIELFVTENHSNYINNNFFLPEKYTRFEQYETNYFYYLFRVFYLATQQALQINWNRNEIYSVEVAIQQAKIKSNDILHNLENDFPDLVKEYQTIKNHINPEQLHAFEQEWLGKLSINTTENKFSQMDKTANQWKKTEENDKQSIELNSVTKENIEILEVDKEKQEQYTLTHNFEKIETLDDFNGNWRDFDDEEDLLENQEALDELNRNQMVRVDSPSHSLLHAEFFNSNGIKEANHQEHIAYTNLVDEWDYLKKSYKKEYCKVLQYFAKEQSPTYTQQTLSKYGSVLKQLDKKLNQFYTTWLQVRKQQDGESLDLDAIVERFTDYHTGYTPSDVVFIAKRKRSKDMALLILTDMSLSTDGYVEGFRILDTEKNALILFGELLDKYYTSFQLDCFSSKTRNQCNYQTIKKFDEKWDKSKHRIGAIVPNGYTRIGAAIRQAHEHLMKHSARKKWLLLLTDGKPNDYDRYEGKYGIEDVKQAVREVRKDGIYLSALAIEQSAKFYLPQMLGKGAYHVVYHPYQLPEALTDTYIDFMKSN